MMDTTRSAAPVLLVGAADDAHVAALAERLRGEHVDVVVFDTLAFPNGPTLELGAGLDEIMIDGRPLGRPGAVYVRGLYGHPLAFGVDVRAAMAERWELTLVAFREKFALLRGLLGRWQALGVPVFNPMSADWRTDKPCQLALLRAAGLPVPETLWTNDPAALRRFAAGRRLIYKPVYGGAATRELETSDLSDARLAALRHAPVTFQELLPGDNLRVYVLDDRVIAALKIVATELDYRQSEETIEAVELAPELAVQCVAAARAVGLCWTGIDLKEDSEGRPRFLELNASPMFLGFDARGGTDILGHLARALADAARRA